MDSSTTKIKTRLRLIGLDLLRLLAIMLVLGRHMWPPPADWSEGWKVFLLTWQRGGWVGVDLFFVLSGFLVSGLLFSEYKLRSELSIRRFYTRRWWKIYPPFFVLIVTTIIVDLLYGLPISLNAVGAEIFFVQSYLPGLWGYTWSLAVEEHFYLILPLSLMLILRWRKNTLEPLRPILGMAALICGLALLLRLVNAHYHPVYSHLRHLFASHLRIDALFFGVSISYLYHFHTNRFVEVFYPVRKWLILGGILLLLPVFIFQLETTPLIYTIGLTIFYLGSGLILMGVLLSEIPENRPLRLLATLGSYSYSIYLWHMPFILWGVPLIDAVFGGLLGFGIRAIIYLVGALLLGIFMAKLIEVPALRLRDLWFPPSTKGPV
jgi:peptidoglycan/LPS O-acetylase OafA/YrhL